jgi:hypothetical protein
VLRQAPGRSTGGTTDRRQATITIALAAGAPMNVPFDGLEAVGWFIHEDQPCSSASPRPGEKLLAWPKDHSQA